MKILLVDDHSLFVEGLTSLLSAHGFDIVGTAGDGFEALNKARCLRPDVILMDVNMPRCDGIQATRMIKLELPDIKVVMLSISEDDDDLFAAIQAGASGYLLKTLDAGEFLVLLSGLHQGQAPLAWGLNTKLVEEFARRAHQPAAPNSESESVDHKLTSRQIAVLTLAAQGMTYKEIGAALCLSTRTVKHHMSQVMQRLGSRNRSQAIACGQRMGLLATGH